MGSKNLNRIIFLITLILVRLSVDIVRGIKDCEQNNDHKSNFHFFGFLGFGTWQCHRQHLTLTNAET